VTLSITHVITRMIVGGAQENTLASVQGLSKIAGYDVSLLTGPEIGTEGSLLAGLDPQFDLVYVPSMIRTINPLHDAMALRFVHQHFRSTRPDVVHTHSSKAGIIGRLAAKAANVPFVVHTLHSLVFHDYQPALVRTAYRQVKRSMAPLTDHYVSVSDDIRERAIEAGIGTPDRHSTVRSGFETAAFESALVPRRHARQRLGLPDDRVVVGVVGRLFPLKGHEEILQAMPRVLQKHPDVLFAFVGSGPFEPHLRELVSDQGLERHVVFTGRMAPDDMPIAFSSFDILAHTSLREGLARVIPQGVLARLPVVCYDLDGSREVIEDGKNGFLVPPRDTIQLADRLDSLIGDEQLRAQLAGVGAADVRHDYSVEEMVRRLDQLYQRLAHESSRRNALRAARPSPR
jgi:glycosyltransferase involved in cell wall biosynthesis